MKDLGERIGEKVERMEIGNVDLLRETAVIKVSYRGRGPFGTHRSHRQPLRCGRFPCSSCWPARSGVGQVIFPPDQDTTEWRGGPASSFSGAR